MTSILEPNMNIQDSAKTVLCYGDSNTWGRVPHGNRYPRSVRWTGVLEKLLGSEYEVISEGLSGRTFVATDPAKPHRTGITHLKAILGSHTPIDLVIVMLGTNDVKTIYDLKPEDIANHLGETIRLIQEEENPPKILVVCPPEIIIPQNNDLNPHFVNGPELSKKLPPLYKAVAEKYGCSFLNAQDYISSSKIDGFHFDADAHAKLAEALKREIMKSNF